MNIKNNKHSSKTVGIACGLLFIALIYGYNKLSSIVPKPKVTITPKSKYTSNIDSGPRVQKIIKSIKVIPVTKTPEVSRWITSGDWSYDLDPLTITISSQRLIMDIDYVEDHWDDYLSDPEDELEYPPELFQ